MHRCRSAAVIAALLLVPGLALAETAPAAAPEQPTQSAAPPETGAPAEHVHVDGFRSAQWGMTDAQVKAAIHKDFNIPANAIKQEENLAERTTVLTVTVPDLLEGAGTARVSYILGFATKKLIQVNVLWGGAANPQAQAEKIVAAANELRQLLVDSGYQPNTVVSNPKMPDGSILVFRGQDADNHMTILRLASAPETPSSGHGAKSAKPGVIAALSLSYILDAHNPNIYRLKKGQF